MGRVVELLSGSDHKTRCVRVKRSDSSVEVYSINHLYPLELSLLTTEPEKVDSDVLKRTEDRPTRAAASKCKDKLKLMYK